MKTLFRNFIVKGVGGVTRRSRLHRAFLFLLFKDRNYMTMNVDKVYLAEGEFNLICRRKKREFQEHSKFLSGKRRR
jgi:hypothetical protein